MTFEIDCNKEPESRSLIYRADEYSFDMEPWSHVIDFELLLNQLTMSVVDNRIIQISGFCGLTKVMNSDIEVPEYERGILRIKHRLEYGFIYGINDVELSVQLNSTTGWICIGDISKKDYAVEFIDNCIAVIDDVGELKALWLKPMMFPTF